MKGVTQGYFERQEEIKALKRVPLDPRRTIPAPEIFADLADADQQSLPSSSVIAVHLELLEAFLALKQKVLISNALDRAFSIVPEDKLITVGRKRTRQADPTFQKRRLVKWPIYVRLAAARFLKWWESLDSVLWDEDRLSPGHGVIITEKSFPPLGKNTFLIEAGHDTDKCCRCPHGLAFLHAQTCQIQELLSTDPEKECLLCELSLGIGCKIPFYS
jgi:hypothetical protein